MAVYKNKEELMNTDWQAKINEATGAGTINVSEDLCRTQTVLDRLGIMKKEV